MIDGHDEQEEIDGAFGITLMVLIVLALMIFVGIIDALFLDGKLFTK